ncbi:N-acetylneuraminate synthase [Gammaproteobacteria bacterium]|jgi:N-acetylneuraminate synthase|nr:N-acetylneuraminate synthase [Gammaproteobacteria bacterium]
MTLIIAEAGVNHNGDLKLAMDLVEAAHNAGADIVKFQTFKAKNLVTKYAKQAEYQVGSSGIEESQFNMLSRLELSYEAHYKLITYCKKLGIEFLSTAFDSESLDFLINDLGLTRLKVPSGELTNAPLVLQHARTGCDLIVSTGMATLDEIEVALGVIAFGYTSPKDAPPSVNAFRSAYASEIGQSALKEKVTLLHCTTEYPAPICDINLRAMATISSAFGLRFGYSDHSEGIVVPIAAVALGAIVIEKHFTLDKSMPGPDHTASLEPSELLSMVECIRMVDSALGDGVKGPRPSEVKNMVASRKSIVAAREIHRAQIIEAGDLAIKRPGNGQSPYRFWDIQGKKASRDYNEGDLIDE